MSRLSQLVYVAALDKVLSIDDLLTIGGGFANLAMAHLRPEESEQSSVHPTVAPHENGPWNETGAWGSGNAAVVFDETPFDTEVAPFVREPVSSLSTAPGGLAGLVPEGAPIESLVKPLGYGFYEVTLRGPDGGPLVQTVWLSDDQLPPQR